MDLFGLRRRALESLRAEFAAEGVVLLEASVRGSLTRRNYRAPGKRISLDKRLVFWTVCITGQRLLVRAGAQPYVDVPWGDEPHLKALAVSVDGPSLLIAFDPSAFTPDTSGQVEVRARVADPAAALALIESHR